MKPVSITDKGSIPFNLPGGVTVNVPRLDFLDEDTFDAMQEALVEADVEEQFIGVAADIAESKPGTKLQWAPLLEGTKKRLQEMGVEVERVVNDDGVRIDEVSADEEAAEQFTEYEGRKPKTLRKRAKANALLMLGFVLEKDDLKHFDKLRVGQLDQVLAEWRRHSRVSVGE